MLLLSVTVMSPFGGWANSKTYGRCTRRTKTPTRLSREEWKHWRQALRFVCSDTTPDRYRQAQANLSNHGDIKLQHWWGFLLFLLFFSSKSLLWLCAIDVSEYSGGLSCDSAQPMKENKRLTSKWSSVQADNGLSQTRCQLHNLKI